MPSHFNHLQNLVAIENSFQARNPFYRDLPSVDALLSVLIAPDAVRSMTSTADQGKPPLCVALHMLEPVLLPLTEAASTDSDRKRLRDRYLRLCGSLVREVMLANDYQFAGRTAPISTSLAKSFGLLRIGHHPCIPWIGDRRRSGFEALWQQAWAHPALVQGLAQRPVVAALVAVVGHGRGEPAQCACLRAAALELLQALQGLLAHELDLGLVYQA